MDTGRLPADEEAYFSANPAPATLKKHVAIAREFVQRQAGAGRRVAVVTSGGTTVPLENQTVRFIDNFSAGTRGATSAEYFLKAGYAVLFLHRQFSLLPYSRHFSHSTNCFLDFMQTDATGRVVVDDEYQAHMSRVLSQYQTAKRNGTLVLLPFVTINDYLWDLREIAKLMRPLGSDGVFYLAAAVSDFFVPKNRMAEHKIQSVEQFNPTSEQNTLKRQQSRDQQSGVKPAATMHDQKLIIDLDPVPKFLKSLVDGWAPDCMIVSFKLETDPAILTVKANYALQKYAHHLVIGNLLLTRKWEVVFVSRLKGEQWIRVPRKRRQKSFSGVPSLVGRAENNGSAQDQEDEQEEAGDPIVEIESIIIPEVKKLHDQLIAVRSSTASR